MQRRLRSSGLLQVVDFTNCHTASSESVLTLWCRRCIPRPRNFSWLRHVNEFPRQEDSVNMFRCAEAASFHSPFSVQTHDLVTCPQSSGLLYRDTGRYSSTSSLAASVSDECSCSTNLLVVQVWSHHSAPPSTSLAEGKGMDWRQTRCTMFVKWAINGTSISWHFFQTGIHWGLV